jgi:hypothetical protein
MFFTELGPAHILHDQYLALSLGPGLSQLCLALNDFLLAGSFVLILSPVPSPNCSFLTLPVLGFLTYT